MFVIKRDGRKEPVHFDKITARITKLSYGLNPDFCDPVSIPRAAPSGEISFSSGSAPTLDTAVLRRLLASAANGTACTVIISNGGSAADAASRCLQVLVAQKVTMGVYKGVTTSELDELAAETAASLTATHPDYALVRSNLQYTPPSYAGHPRYMSMPRPPSTTWRSVMQLAARIAVSNLHKSTLKSFSETCAVQPMALMTNVSAQLKRSTQATRPQSCFTMGNVAPSQCL